MKRTKAPASGAAKSHRARRPVIEEVEPRILYSADFSPSLLDDPTPLQQPEQRLLDSSGEFASAAGSESIVQPDLGSSDSGDAAQPGGDWELELLLAEDPAPAVDGEQPDAGASPVSAQVQLAIASTPLAFELNVGQTDAEVDFLARGSGYSVWLTDGDAVIALKGEDISHVLRLDVMGSNPDAVASGEGLLGGTSNYLLGAQAQWQTDLANFQGVYYDEIYEGIDLRYYGNQRQLEYDFILDPGADVGEIRLGFDGMQGAAIADSGELVLDLGDGQAVVFKAPVAWQDGPAGREAVASRYLQREDGSIGFEVGAYERTRALIIDPVFAYGTYLGGSSGDQVLGMSADSAGNVYVTGFTQSANFPTTAGAYRTSDLGGEDVFVTKLTPNLSGFVYSTYLGGNASDEEGYNIAVDSAGNAYVTGYTTSTDFPVVSAYQTSLNGGWDAFVAKLNPAGNALVYSTYLGGSGAADTGYGIAVDATGNAYVAGYATDASFPTTVGAADTSYAQGEGFVTKLSAAGNSLVYSTYIGGSNFDAAYAIAVDAAGDAVIVGATQSNDLPVTANAFQNTRDGGLDILVAKLNAAGSAFTYSTYLGGNKDEQGLGVTLGPGGKIYLTGSTGSNDFDVTVGALQPSGSGLGDAIVSVLNPSLSGAASLVYSTYLGGSNNNEDAWNISVDGAGRIYLAGSTDSDDFPTTAGAYRTTRAGASDVFVVQINPVGGGASDLLYGSYWGGTNTDSALTGVYANGTFYFAGATDSVSSIATAGTVDTSYNGGTDGFVAAFSFYAPPVVSVNATPLAYTENAGAQLLDASLTLSDADSPTLSGATLQFTANYAIGEDSLFFSNANSWGISGTWSAASGLLTLTGASSVGNYELALRSVTYANASQSPSTLTRSVRILASDGGTTSAPAVRQINVTSVNDVPAISAPASQAMNEDGTLIFSSGAGNAIAVSDLDAGTSPVRLTLTGTSGTLTLFQTSGLTFTSGDGAGDASMTFTGTISNINAALNGLRFNPNLHYNGGASVQVSINDLGNTGTPGAQSANRSVAVAVAAVNDAPVGTNKNGIGWHATGAEFLVNTTTGNNQTEVTTAMDANGNFVVVYSADGGQDGNGKGIYAQRYNAAGVAQGAEFRVNTTTAGDQKAASVAMDSNGDFVVTWTSSTQDPDGSAGIYAQRYNASGVAQGAEFRVNVTTTLAQDQSAVAMDASGNFTVAWKDASSAANADIFARRYDAAGTALSSEFRVNTDTTNNQDKATIAMNGSGAFVIAWKSKNPLDGSGTGVFAQRYDSAGVAQGGEILVNTTFSGNQDKPSAAMTADGRFVIAWVSGNDQDGDMNGVFAQRFDASGVKQGGEFQVNTDTVDNQDVPAIAIDGSGSFTIVWSSNLQDGANKGIYAQSYAADGSAILGAVLVNTTTAGTQDQPSIAMRANGDFVIVWNGNGPGDAAGVFGQRYLSNKTVTTLEDTDYVFTAADFGFTDPSDSPVNALSNVKITTLPGAGTLKLSGVPVTAGQFVSVANINAGNLKFTPVANASGAGYASFTFQVQDDGGTAAGGVDLDPTPNTITIDVTAVNDAPVGTNMTVTTLEDTIYTFTAADFGFTDPSDSPVNALLNVKITTIPGAGALELSGVAVTAGQFVSVANITAGNLTFTPVANANGAGYASFTFQVQDDGGTANSGVDLDTAARTMTVNVTAVNDAPVGTSKTVTTLEDSVYTFTAVDFGFTDPADSPVNVLLNVKITTLPGAGALELSGVAVTAGQFVSVANITAGNLKFTPVANANGAGYASFTFQVQDDGGTANSGVDLDTAARTMTVNVTSVNDAPSNTVPGAQGTARNTPLVFSAGNGNAIAVADADAGAGLLQVTLSATNGSVLVGPAVGAASITGDGTATVTITGSAGDVNSALSGMSFTPTLGYSGAGSLQIVTNDQGNTGAGGPLSDSDTVAITVANNVPASVSMTASTLSYAENDSATPVDANLTVGDPDSALLDHAHMTITSGYVNGEDLLEYVFNPLLPAITATWNAAAGELTLWGAASPAEYQQALRTVTYRNLSEQPGSAPRTITVEVEDGISVDAGSFAVRSLSVTAVNDAPVISVPAIQSAVEDTALVFSTGNGNAISIADADAASASIRLTLNAGNGVLTLASAAGLTFNAGGDGTASMTVTGTRVDLIAALDGLRFDPTADYSGAASVSVTVDDLGNSGTGGALTDSETISINVMGANDPPTITSDGGGGAASRSVAENSTFVTDVDGADIDLPAQTLAYSIAGGADAARFTIDALSGVLSFVTGPDREAPTDADLDSVYQVSVRVSDGNGGFALQTLMVTVLDADEFDVGPVTDANGSANSVAEDAAIGTSAGITALASDADATTNTITYSLDDSAGGLFAINAASGVVSVAGALDAETAVSHSIIVRAISADGSASTQSFVIGVTDVNDWAVGPVSDNDPTPEAVNENLAPGALVGYTALAIDPDVTNNAITYSLVDDAGGRFAINAATGVVTTAAVLDYEAAGSHSIIVRATSSDGSSGTALVNITVGDVNEAPLVNNQSFTVDENSVAGTVVGSVLASDPDAGDVLSYAILSGNTGGAFAIDAAGQITVANSAALDFETVPVFSLSVAVVDAGGLSDTATVSVNLNNVNDPPLAAGDAATTTEDATLNVLAAAGVLANDIDLEGGALTVTAVEGNPADVGNTIVLGSGALLRLNANGSYDYDPNGAFDWLAAGDTGFDSFSYAVSDPGGASSSASVTITLSGVNDAPLGFDSVVSAAEDTPYVFSSGDFGFADPDSSLQAVTIASLPAQGSLTLAGAPVVAGTVVRDRKSTRLNSSHTR